MVITQPFLLGFETSSGLFRENTEGLRGIVEQLREFPKQTSKLSGCLLETIRMSFSLMLKDGAFL